MEQSLGLKNRDYTPVQRGNFFWFEPSLVLPPSFLPLFFRCSDTTVTLCVVIFVFCAGEELQKTRAVELGVEEQGLHTGYPQATLLQRYKPRIAGSWSFLT
uniref:Uncharacterized protein n=1 Tax=Salix viminalis TaxID=40686 RepID=A0A6N2K7K0_SALVM